jgi:hypothetical protein
MQLNFTVDIDDQANPFEDDPEWYANIIQGALVAQGCHGATVTLDEWFPSPPEGATRS